MRISDWSSDVCSSDLVLESQEYPDPSARPGPDDQGAVLVRPVEPAERLAAALIHVDVVHAAVGGEAEMPVDLAGLRSPALAEGMEAGRAVAHGFADERSQVIPQIVVRTVPAKGRLLHVVAPHQAAPDIVEGKEIGRAQV